MRHGEIFHQDNDSQTFSMWGGGGVLPGWNSVGNTELCGPREAEAPLDLPLSRRVA